MSCVVVALTYLSNINFADHNHLYPQKTKGKYFTARSIVITKKLKTKKMKSILRYKISPLIYFIYSEVISQKIVKKRRSV